ncbi:hypothetical protein AAMO2058_001130600 [Amorphochlora amoebiformis]
MSTFFEQICAGEVVEGISHEIYTVDEFASISEALGLLHKYHVLSLPVVSEGMKYKGVLNVADIIHEMVFHPTFVRSVQKYEAKEISAMDIIRKAGDEILHEPVSAIVGKRPESKYLWAFKNSDKMSKIAEYFRHGSHRVLLHRDEKSGGDCILSQSDAVRYIRHHLTDVRVHPVARLTLEEHGIALGGKNIVTASPTETALSAFRRLLSTHWSRRTVSRNFRSDLSAMPIVDSNGKVVGTLSQSDLRGLNSENLHELVLPLNEFCKRASARDARPTATVSVTPQTTLQEAICKVVDNKVHRAWIMDHERVVGVVSLTDIIARFSPYDFSFLNYYQNVKLSGSTDSESSMQLLCKL